MKREIHIDSDKIVGMGNIDGKFTICIDDEGVEWLVFDEEVLKLIMEWQLLHG